MRKAMAFGLLLTTLVAAGLLLTAKPAHAATFEVDSTADTDTRACTAADPDCTLRGAINAANATLEADTINFDIGGGTGVKTISPTSPLPDITNPVTIDGYSQPGSSENTLEKGTDAVLKIELDGTNAGLGADALIIPAPDTTVRGLVVNRFSGFGILPTGPRDKIEGNFIGTDPTGTLDRGNSSDSGDAVFVNDTDITVGGASPATRNLISGNDGDGVFIAQDSSGVKVQGNLIGTKKDGASALGNSDDGVNISAPNNTIGGTTPEETNIIAFNTGDGVVIVGDNESTGNRILGNSIFSNGQEGIDLNNDGPTPNDSRDGDKGENRLQNFPVITSVTSSVGQTTITGTLKSTPRKNFTIQFFVNPAGEDEGKTFLGETKVRTNRKGKASFTFSSAVLLAAGANVTATATDEARGDTSEFSVLAS